MHLTHVRSKRVPLSNEDEWGWEDNARTKRDLEAGSGNEVLGMEELNSVLRPPSISVSERTLKTNNLKRPGFASSSSNGNGNGNGNSAKSFKAHSKKKSPSISAKNLSSGKPIYEERDVLSFHFDFHTLQICCPHFLLLTQVYLMQRHIFFLKFISS
jgi:hypothetical protein